MIPTMPVTTVMKKWRDILAADPAVKAFCLSKYGKEPMIFLGNDVRNSPEEDSCPYIMLLPGDKVEGMLKEYEYQASIGWVIYQEEVTVTGNVVEFNGLTEVDELGQLILKAVNEGGSVPFKRIDYDIDYMAMQPQYGGRMDIKIEIPFTIGGTIEY